MLGSERKKKPVAAKKNLKGYISEVDALLKVVWRASTAVYFEKGVYSQNDVYIFLAATGFFSLSEIGKLKIVNCILGWSLKNKVLISFAPRAVFDDPWGETFAQKISARLNKIYMLHNEVKVFP